MLHVLKYVFFFFFQGRCSNVTCFKILFSGYFKNTALPNVIDIGAPYIIILEHDKSMVFIFGNTVKLGPLFGIVFLFSMANYESWLPDLKTPALTRNLERLESLKATSLLAPPHISGAPE